MANATTINLLVRRVRQRADQINSLTFDDATELKPWIRGSMAQLYELIVDRWNDYYVISRPVSLGAGASSYALPSDFRALHDVFVVGGQGGRKARLPQFNAEDMGAIVAGTGNGAPRAYRVMRDVLYLMPTPVADAINALELWYTPQYKGPLLDYSPISDVLPTGWEEWMVLDVLLKMAHKTRLQNIEAIERERQRVEQRLMSHAAIRTSDAAVMRDMYRETAASWGQLLITVPRGPAYWSAA